MIRRFLHGHSHVNKQSLQRYFSVTSVQFSNARPCPKREASSLQLKFNKAKEIKPPEMGERELGGWRCTKTSKEFPETALRAILQEYEIRLRDNLFKFQKDKYKDMTVNDFLKQHYRFSVKQVYKEAPLCMVKTRKMKVGQAPWWWWVMVLNTNKRKNHLRWQAWKKVRQKLGISKPSDNTWMIRRRVKKRLPQVPAVYDDIGTKCFPRIHIKYKVLDYHERGEKIYEPKDPMSHDNINRQLWWHLENPFDHDHDVD